MIFRIQAICLSALAITLLGSQLRAQGSLGGPGPEPPPPGPLSDAVFGKVVAGDLSGDLSLDAVMLDAGIPTLAMAPEVYRTSVRGDDFVNDISFMPTPSGLADRLFAVGPQGLQELTYDNVEFDMLSSQDLGGGNWHGARAVAAVALDGSAQDDLVGLADSAVDARGVLIMHADGRGGFTPAPGFQTGLAAHWVLGIDWDNDGTDELAFHTDFGIEIYQPDGTPITALSWSESSILGAVFDDSDHAAGQRLAVCFEFGGNDWILVLDSAGGETAVPFGALGVVSMAAGDQSGDGHDDLFLSITTLPQYVRVTALPDADKADPADPTFVVSQKASVPFGAPGRDTSANQAGLVTGDFDRDGDLDVLAPSQGNYTSGGPPAPRSSVELVLGTSSPTGGDLRLGITAAGANWFSHLQLESLQITVTPPAVTLPAVRGQQKTKLEVELWKSRAVYKPMAPEVHTRAYVDIPAAGGSDVVVDVFGTTSPNPERDIWSMVIRQVVVDLQTSEVIQTGPCESVVIALGSNKPYLYVIPGSSGNVLDLYVEQCPACGTPIMGGGVGVGSSRPDAEDDEGTEGR